MTGKNRHALKSCLLASVALAAMTAAGPACAADKPPARQPVETWSWGGFYVGGHAGYGWARDPFNNTVLMADAPLLTLPGISANGALGGFQAGANWQAGSWVGGLEIDFSTTRVKGSTSATTGVVPTPFPLTTVIENLSQTDTVDWVGSGRARLGYLPWPNVLLYGTGGPAWARIVETSGQQFQETSPFDTFAVTSTTAAPTWRLGVAAGAGIEARIADTNWLGRLEYLHYDFGKSASFALSDGVGITRGNVTLDVVRAGLAYKLGRGAGFAGAAMANAKLLKAPLAAAAPWTWSGFYIGGHAGFGWGHDPVNIPKTGFSGIITETDIESNGLVGGFQAGANWQANNAWVGGIEIDLSGSGIKGSNTYVAPLTAPLTGTDTLTQSDRFELLGSARARLGYLLSPQTLLYGTGGLAWTRFVQETDEAVNITAGPQPSVASGGAGVAWELGWVVGGGVEARLRNSNWLGRVEYLHYDFGEAQSGFSQFFGTSFSSGHPTADLVRGGLSYKFDWHDPAMPAANPAMPVKARPAVAAAANWSGIYVGGHAGHGSARDPESAAVLGGGSQGALLPTSTDASGNLGGFQAGANWQIGALAGGLEIDLSATGIKGSTGRIPVAGIGATATQTEKFDLLGSARLRAGYLARPDLLLYGTGGLAWTRLDTSLLINSVFGGASGVSTPSLESGWVAGGGAEARLPGTNWLLRAEYLHYDFGDSGGFQSTRTNIFPGTNEFGVDSATSGHLIVDVVRSALSYKLD